MGNYILLMNLDVLILLIILHHDLVML